MLDISEPLKIVQPACNISIADISIRNLYCWHAFLVPLKKGAGGNLVEVFSLLTLKPVRMESIK
jgi:hypothetical protein